MYVIGLMSGTSADGVDAAVLELHGAPPALGWRLLAHRTAAHPPALREAILACCRPGGGSSAAICALGVAIGRSFAAAALAAAAEAGLRPDQIDLIGSHGQTIWHAPQGDPPGTLQIGCAATIAELTGATVVSDFRSRDMAAGGQGAPLVAAVDALLLGHPSLARAAQNIGGIANVTYLPPGGGAALAFDTGPGNMLLDAAAHHLSGGALTYDLDGRMAAAGAPSAVLLAELLAEPYYALPPPKTTGRELFGAAYAERALARAAALGLSAPDTLATLAELTAQSIALAYRRHLPRLPDEVVVSGGGARNPAVMARLRAALPEARLRTSDELGLPGAAKEALAFALLAYESWHGRPGNLPSATGAARAAVLGSITPGLRHPGLPRAGGGLTEERSADSAAIDTLPTLDLLATISRADALAPAAVAAELPRIAQAVDAIAARMRRGGRLIYAGAGTSGRLGALDAAECPPTYSAPPGMVVALVAGGAGALSGSVEGAEDDADAGAAAFAGIAAGPDDTLVGIAASGTTPYVIGALREARARGALTVSLSCNHPTPIAALAEIAIAPLVGPEVISGSTRMKAGTAQKLVLNMISTAVMVRLGKTYGNLMVDLQASNVKLRARARRIVEEATGLAPDAAAALLDASGGEVKVAIVAALAGVAPAAARARLDAAGGAVRAALGAANDGGSGAIGPQRE